jgi:hypothetical protein
LKRYAKKGKIGKAISEKKDGTAYTTAEEWAKASQESRMASYRVFNPPLSVSVPR